MTRYGQTRQTLHKHKLAPSKRFGQNFLVHRQTAESIVHAGKIQPNDTIVEVGVGLGALTIPLAEAAQNVIGLEIDSGIIKFHKDENDLPENVTLLHEDVLKVDFQDLIDRCDGPLKIMANLPYSISNPFLFRLIEHHDKIDWATIMLQKEVADRLMADPGNKQYGIPTVLLQSCASVKKLMTLKPGEFHPRPKIDSVVIRIQFSPKPKRVTSLPAYDHKLFRKIVRATFGNRRKTLLNTMSGANLFSSPSLKDKAEGKKLTEKVIIKAGISPGIRAENLTLEDFVELTINTDKERGSLS